MTSTPDSSLTPAPSACWTSDRGSARWLPARYSERSVVAVELDEALARSVADADADADAAPIGVCVGDGVQLPFPDACFGGVTMLEVLEHVTDPQGMLSEAVRVLRPHGALCVAVPTAYTEHVYSRVHPRYMANATHVRIFRRRALRDQIEASGMTVERVSTENFEPALAWMIHSVLRSNAHPTGWMLDHTGVDPIVARVVGRASRTPGLRPAVGLARRHFGKSCYLYAVKHP